MIISYVETAFLENQQASLRKQLQDSWIAGNIFDEFIDFSCYICSGQPNFDKITDDGKLSLITHKLTEKESFEKISKAIISNVAQSKNDSKIVEEWWDNIHTQNKVTLIK